MSSAGFPSALCHIMTSFYLEFKGLKIEIMTGGFFSLVVACGFGE